MVSELPSCVLAVQQFSLEPTYSFKGGWMVVMDRSAMFANFGHSSSAGPVQLYFTTNASIQKTLPTENAEKTAKDLT